MDGTQIFAVSVSDSPAHWSEQTKGLIKAVFFIGYGLLQVPASFLGQKYGGKTVLNVGLFLTALCTLLTPIAVEYGTFRCQRLLRWRWRNVVVSGSNSRTVVISAVNIVPCTSTKKSLLLIWFSKGGSSGLITLRFFMGVFEAPVYPALIILLSSWIPEKERGRVSSIVFSGGQVYTHLFELKLCLRL